MINPSLVKLYQIIEESTDPKLRHKLYAWIDECTEEVYCSTRVTQQFIDCTEGAKVADVVAEYLAYRKASAGQRLGNALIKLAVEGIYNTYDEREYRYSLLVLK